MLINFRAYQLAVQFFRRTQTLNLKGELKDQLHRASSSVVLNLAEGAGKRYAPIEQRRFYRIAMGSLRESQAVLDLADCTDTETLKLADTLGAHLYTLCK